MTDKAKIRRVVEVRWLPQTKAEWSSFTAARLEAGRLWSTMVRLHVRIRRLQWKWPSYGRWALWAKRKFPNLNSQSVQQTVKDFCECLSATTAAHKVQAKAGVEVAVKFPWKPKKYKDVIYTNQIAWIRNGVLRLSNGKHGNAPFYIKLPKNHPLPGRLMEVQLSYGVVRLVCEVSEVKTVPAKSVGVDLGINTLIAATDGDKCVLVSGRELKSICRFRNKSISSLDSRIDRCQDGSRRRKKLVRAKWKLRTKSAAKLKDVLHKATRIIANEFPNAPVVIGKPFNGAARKLDRRRAQQVSEASNRKLIDQLAYKMSGCAEVEEYNSSQQCPCCGCRQKCGRVYKCQSCGFKAPRDVIGSLNILDIGIYGMMKPRSRNIPVIRFKHPITYSGNLPDRSGGIPAQAVKSLCSS